MSNMALSEGLAKKIVIGVSVLVTLLVILMFYVAPPKVDIGIDLTIFPKFHAILNSIATVLLLAGLFFIKQKNITAHKASMFGALIVSAIFLVSYVTYHTLSEPTVYGGEGALKYVYYFVLLSHILLAAGILPFILFTFYRALTSDFAKHRKIATYTLPLWLYVTVTGVLVYLMISPYY